MIAYMIIALGAAAAGALVTYLAMRGRIDAQASLLAEVDRRHERDLQSLQQSYQSQLCLFREQVTAATEQVLVSRSEALQRANARQMDTIVTPLKEDISRMERTMAETRESSARNHASVEKSIKMMMDQAASLGVQADRLTNALQRNNKVAGNWGELILTELLESQGLQPGVHFDVQATLRDSDGRSVLNEDTGRRMIPDVILHLADNRDVIIDSKMSLTAFIDYQNAADTAGRDEALRRHIDSVKAHIAELSRKNYSAYVKPPRVSTDFVIMFVPVEGALQLVLADSPDLWRDAFDRKVFVVGAQTLMAALRIIDLTWVNVQQERNTQRVMDEARKLIDRVNQFYDQFQGLGRKIREAAEAYDGVADKVSTGKQSILRSGRSLEALGARGKRPLPTPDE